jgi:hypothetical protein
MLCNFCSSIDFEQAYWTPALVNGITVGQKHQPSLQGLIESADRGCELCRLIATENEAYRLPQLVDKTDPDKEQIYCRIYESFTGAPRDYLGCPNIVFTGYVLLTRLSMYVNEGKQ